MLFHSLAFAIFFPTVVLLYFMLPKNFKNYWLLFASYVFYMGWNPKYALLLLACTVFTYFGAIAVNYCQNTKNKKYIIALVLLAVFGILLYFKYTNFLLESLLAFLNMFHLHVTIPKFDIILPVGISFFTFQAAGYLIDVYRKETPLEKNFFRYALFVSFFPQLVAGPIERSNNLLKQMHKTYSFSYRRIRQGLLIMLWGYFLKLVIADRCAIIADTAFSNSCEYTGIQLIVGAIAFSIQIYCDFMGYSTIARGAGKVLGYNLIDNFKQPYFSTSIRDFWRRWHISLSFWLKDYVYIPLGGGEAYCGRFRHYLNIIITFLISGLWHGANWKFVLWGAIHGCCIVLESIFKPLKNYLIDLFKINKNNIYWRALLVIKTFIIINIAWVFFRAENIKSAFVYLWHCTQLQCIGDISCKFGLNGRNWCVLIPALCILIFFSVLRERNIPILKWFDNKNIIIRYLVYWILLLFIASSLDMLGKEFIYFQF